MFREKGKETKKKKNNLKLRYLCLRRYLNFINKANSICGKIFSQLATEKFSCLFETIEAEHKYFLN